MVVLDTCAFIYDALSPKQLGKTARRVIAEAEAAGQLLCSDISLWEIAMLVSKKRLDPGTDALTFLRVALEARAIRVRPISPEVADLSVSFPSTINHDPADRIIVATAVLEHATLVTCDANLRDCGLVKTVW